MMPLKKQNSGSSDVNGLKSNKIMKEYYKKMMLTSLN